MMIVGFFLTTLFTDSLHRCTLRLQADLVNHFPSHSSVRTTCPPAHVHHSSHCLWMFHRLAGCGGKEGSFHISRVAFYALAAFWRTFNTVSMLSHAYAHTSLRVIHGTSGSSLCAVCAGRIVALLSAVSVSVVAMGQGEERREIEKPCGERKSTWKKISLD